MNGSEAAFFTFLLKYKAFRSRLKSTKKECFMKAMRLALGSLVAAVTLAGCVSVAHVERDDETDFSKYHSYAWVETSAKKSDSAAAPVSDLMDKKVREAVDAEMQKKGWTLSKHKPDVLLSYDMLVERTSRTSTNPMYTQPYTRYFFNPYTRRWNALYYPSQFLGYDNDLEQVKEGTLTLSMMDARTDKTVWQGWTTDEVNSSRMSSKEIQKGINSIFRKFDLAKN